MLNSNELKADQNLPLQPAKNKVSLQERLKAHDATVLSHAKQETDPKSATNND